MKILIIILNLCCLVLIGCQRTLGSDLLPTPENGKSILKGYIMDFDGEPLKEVTVRLAEVYRGDQDTQNGAFVLDTAFSPGTITDEQGRFVILNIDPGEYVIVIGDIENNHYVIVAQGDGRPKVWNTIENQVLDAGIIKVRIK